MVHLCIFWAVVSAQTNTCWNFQWCIVSRFQICEETGEQTIDLIKYIVFPLYWFLYFGGVRVQTKPKKIELNVWCCVFGYGEAECVRAYVLFMCTHCRLLYYGNTNHIDNIVDSIIFVRNSWKNEWYIRQCNRLSKNCQKQRDLMIVVTVYAVYTAVR